MKYEEVNKAQLIDALETLNNKVAELWEWTSINTTRLTHYINEFKGYGDHLEALRLNTPYGIAANFDEIDRDAEWGKDTRAKTQRDRNEAEKRYSSARSHFRDEIETYIRHIKEMIAKEEAGENPFPLGN